jgi:hypothetical protein
MALPLLGLALLLPAQAGPAADVHWYGTMGSDLQAMGIGAGAAWTSERVWGELSVDFGGVSPDGFEVHARSAVRLFVIDQEAPWALSVRAGPGVRFFEGMTGYGFAGLAVDTFRSGDLRVRVGADALVDPFGAPGFRLTVGLVLRPDTSDGHARPEPAAEPEVLRPELLPEAMVWMPHPVCQWVPLTMLDPWTDRLEPGAEVRVQAPGFLPSSVPAEALDDLELAPAPPLGGLVVVAQPGDRIQIGEEVWIAPQDGVVTTNVPTGFVEVLVEGYGRSSVLEAAAADGYATWVRAPEGTMRILFEVGSSTLDEQALAAVRQLVENAGEAAFELTGSHSPEGGLEQNERLAADRAFTVAAAMVAAGLPQERVRVLPAAPPEPDLPPTLQRAVVVRPLPTGDSP